MRCFCRFISSTSDLLSRATVVKWPSYVAMTLYTKRKKVLYCSFLSTCSYCPIHFIVPTSANNWWLFFVLFKISHINLLKYRGANQEIHVLFFCSCSLRDLPWPNQKFFDGSNCRSVATCRWLINIYRFLHILIGVCLYIMSTSRVRDLSQQFT